MPRKPLIYTHEHPYHISARSNNKEWFYLSMSECWNIFAEGLNRVRDRYEFQTHLFVLMNNHYHLIGQCSEKHNLGEVMSWLQKFVSRKINGSSGRINHIFGGPYRGCLIQDPRHYARVYKYVARNPISAGIEIDVFKYPYTTLNKDAVIGRKKVKVALSKDWTADLREIENLSDWLNSDLAEAEYFMIRTALTKTVFRMKNRSTRSLI